MNELQELDVSALNGLSVTQNWLVQLGDAIDAASNQDQVTWLTEDGKRIAAIVPAGVAERELRTVDEVFDQAGRAISDQSEDAVS